MSLHDILPPIQIHDYTFFYMGLGLLGLCAVIFKRFYKRQKKDINYYLHILDHCDFQDAKKTALQFSYYGRRIFINEEEKAQFSELQQRLERYKYIQLSTAIPLDLEDDIKQLLQQARQYHA